MKVYLYTEYDDEMAFGEIFNLVFSDIEKAKETLSARVERWFGDEYTFSEILANKDGRFYHEDDTVRDDYVSIPNGCGGYIFFTITPMEVE